MLTGKFPFFSGWNQVIVRERTTTSSKLFDWCFGYILLQIVAESVTFSEPKRIYGQWSSIMHHVIGNTVTFYAERYKPKIMIEKN